MSKTCMWTARILNAAAIAVLVISLVVAMVNQAQINRWSFPLGLALIMLAEFFNDFGKYSADSTDTSCVDAKALGNRRLMYASQLGAVALLGIQGLSTLIFRAADHTLLWLGGAALIIASIIFRVRSKAKVVQG